MQVLEMRLQKQLSRKVAGKEYSKWVITIPSREIEELGWGVGEELRTAIEENRLVLKSVRKRGST